MAGGERKALLNMHLHPAAIFHSTTETQPGALQTPQFPPPKAPGLSDFLSAQGPLWLPDGCTPSPPTEASTVSGGPARPYSLGSAPLGTPAWLPPRL